MTDETVDRLRVTMRQMERLIRALDDLMENIIPKAPQLFAVMSEGPLEDLGRLRQEVEECIEALSPAA